ncbi:pyridoxamine kinase [Clostridium sardiniense]|uniref:pyridoxamine kinase n=1 Tax=Clostridium sardiniense TaxID=29369 RepID=UPI003D32BE02
MKKPIKRALIIHSLCSVGKASLTNIIPVMSIRGVEACPIPSIILSTHTGGFNPIARLDSQNFIKEATDCIRDNGINFDLTLIGYLGGVDKIQETISYLKENREGIVVLDTIFGDNGKLYNGFTEEYVEYMRELLKLSDIITPNFTEALYLTGRDASDIDNFNEENIKDVIYDLRKIGAKNIVITSVPCNNIGIGVAVCDGENIRILCHEKLSKSYPGTGDIFTAVLSTEILKGNNLLDGINKSAEFVKECIKYSMEYDYPTKEGVLLEKQLYKLL